MGHSPATAPPVLLDTAAEQLVVSSAVDDKSEVEETLANEVEEMPADDDGSLSSTSTTESDGKHLKRISRVDVVFLSIKPKF